MIDRIREALRRKRRQYEAQRQIDRSDGDYAAHAGREGEVIVYASLKQDDNYIINNFTFYAKPEMSVQIDHIMVDTMGVHAIETKTWSGTVQGHMNDDAWLVINRDDESHYYTNAYKQNEFHVRELAKYLEVPSEYRHVLTNMLAFVNIRHLELTLPDHYEAERVDRVLLVRPKPYPALSPQTVQAVYQLLLEKDQHIPKEEHIRNVKNYLEKTKKKNRRP